MVSTIEKKRNLESQILRIKKRRICILAKQLDEKWRITIRKFIEKYGIPTQHQIQYIRSLIKAHFLRHGIRRVEILNVE
jgi:1-aminocyclopropane-1-carboxylate deaminase/D-cysteine desulfhydrase-like pyridoxal-dependent ACC family enzyme